MISIREPSADRTALTPELRSTLGGRISQAIGSLPLLLALAAVFLAAGVLVNTILLPISGFFLGWALASRYLRRGLRRLRAQLETDSALERENRSPPRGLPELDELACYHNRKVSALMEVIRSVQEHADDMLERYETLTANLAAAVVVRDSTNKVVFCSPFTEVLTGYALAEIFAAEKDFFLGIVHDEDREKYERSLRISATGEPFQFRYRLFHRTGIELWVETRAVPILDDNGEVISTLSITLDVTATARYQRQIEEKNRDLQDFTYMVSHDLKAPIFTIKGMLSIFDEDAKDGLSSDAKESLQHIHKATITLERLVTGVLEYVRITNQDGVDEEVSLNQVFLDILNDHSTQIKDTLALIEVPPDLPVIISDRLKLYQIFSNLIGNALKYRDPARRLEIKVKLLATRSPQDLALAISDNGLGIPQDKQALIFRPFQRAHGKAFEGSGIGLACVRKLVDRLGGSVSVESSPGQGSTFTVTLQRVRQAVDAPIASQREMA